MLQELRLIDVPTLDKQRKIVSMLDVIQAKLCINSHTNDYLAAESASAFITVERAFSPMRY